MNVYDIYIYIFIFLFAPSGIGDGHAREALLTTMGTGLRVSAQASHQGEVKVELVHQPILGLLDFLANWKCIWTSQRRKMKRICSIGLKGGL